MITGLRRRLLCLSHRPQHTLLPSLLAQLQQSSPSSICADFGITSDGRAAHAHAARAAIRLCVEDRYARSILLSEKYLADQRTVPTRPTDGSHLRDGFSRAIVARQDAAKKRNELSEEDNQVCSLFV